MRFVVRGGVCGARWMLCACVSVCWVRLERRLMCAAVAVPGYGCERWERWGSTCYLILMAALDGFGV